MRRNAAMSGLAVLALALCGTAACGGAAEDEAEVTEEPSILPPGGATGGDTTADVGDMGTGTGDAQSGGAVTGEVPDSVAAGAEP